MSAAIIDGKAIAATIREEIRRDVEAMQAEHGQVPGLATVLVARGIDTIAEDFKIARPHWFPSVPRVYEKVHTKIISGAQAKAGHEAR